MAKQQYGITVSSKDGARSATEWFTSEVERDQFYAWYTDHKRVCVRVQRDDEQAAAREKEQALADQRRLRVIFEALNNGQPKLPQYPEAQARHDAALLYARELLKERGVDPSGPTD